MSQASFTIFLKDAPLNPSFKKCLSAVSNIFSLVFSAFTDIWFILQCCQKYNNVISHCYINFIYWYCQEYTWCLTGLFFSLKPGGTGAMDLFDSFIPRNSCWKIADLMQPICFYFFIDKHLQKYHPRDILIYRKEYFKVQKKKPDSTKYIR